MHHTKREEMFYNSMTMQNASPQLERCVFYHIRFKSVNLQQPQLLPQVLPLLLILKRYWEVRDHSVSWHP